MKKIALTILILAIIGTPAAVNTSWAQDSAPATAAAPSSVDTGLRASEILRGNGGRGGYVLGHGNVIANSESVSIGTKIAKKNVDYTIDYNSGSIFFTESVRQSESIRIDYRYSETNNGSRPITGIGGLPLNFAGNKLSANLTFAYRAAADPTGNAAPIDILTYGLNSTTKLWGTSSLSGMMFVSSPQKSSRLSISSDPATLPNAAPVKRGAIPPANPTKTDHLMVQNADLGIGKVRLQIGMQDVGENFAGFQSMRDSSSVDKALINQLELERGIKRLNVSTALPLGKAGGLEFSRQQIKDSADDISSQTLAYNGSNFKASYFTRSVGSKFTRFLSLAEADKLQMAAERGIKRTGYSLQFKTGVAAENAPVWSGLNITNLQSGNYQLSYKTADLNLKGLSIQADLRDADSQFTNLSALTMNERQRMALMARRQFDPASQASQVTAIDTTKILGETGINREIIAAQLNSGPMFLSLSQSNIDSDTGGLNHSGINLKYNNYNFHFNHHSIDNTFNKLSLLQPIELIHFGNEYGMTRTEAGGTGKLSFGDFAWKHANVTDHRGAIVSRDSMNIAGKKVQIAANFQNIDPEFNRILDLSDTDKLLLIQDKGFHRADYSIALQPNDRLNIKSYFYDSTNTTANQTRGQTKHEISYTMKNGLKLTGLTDNYAYVNDSGLFSSYSRQKFTVDTKLNLLGGLQFKALNDELTTEDANGNLVNTHVTQTHFETDQNAKLAYTMDILQTNAGNGHTANNIGFGLKSKMSDKLSLLASFVNTSEIANDSKITGALGFDWALKKDLTMTLNIQNSDTHTQGKAQVHKFSLNGLLAKKLLLFDNVNVASAVNKSELRGKQLSCDNAMKVTAGLLGGSILFDNSDKLNPINGLYYTSRIFQFESDKDPKKWYHLTYYNQELITPTGAFSSKKNYAADFKLTPKLGLTLTSYFGKDGANGIVLPIGGSVYKLNYAIDNKSSWLLDYRTDRNESILKQARTFGIGYANTLSDKAALEIYLGWSKLLEAGITDYDPVFRVKYDHKIDASRYITLSAQKKSVVDRNIINPNEGYVSAKLEFNTLFH